MTGRLTHLDEEGAARMVDVAHKDQSDRFARAEGRIRMNDEALSAIRAATLAKGDAIATARIAGIMAAKKTSDLIPLCHPLPLTSIRLDFSFEDTAIRVEGHVGTKGQTGVEMEALCAVNVALLTLYDMAKALDRSMIIEGVRLLEKRGGTSGNWTAHPA